MFNIYQNDNCIQFWSSWHIMTVIVIDNHNDIPGLFYIIWCYFEIKDHATHHSAPSVQASGVVTSQPHQWTRSERFWPRGTRPRLLRGAKIDSSDEVWSRAVGTSASCVLWHWDLRVIQVWWEKTSRIFEAASRCMDYMGFSYLVSQYDLLPKKKALNLFSGSVRTTTSLLWGACGHARGPRAELRSKFLLRNLLLKWTGATRIIRWRDKKGTRTLLQTDLQQNRAFPMCIFQVFFCHHHIVCIPHLQRPPRPPFRTGLADSKLSSSAAAACKHSVLLVNIEGPVTGI